MNAHGFIDEKPQQHAINIQDPVTNSAINFLHSSVRSILMKETIDCV